jgi:hypothetical protein
LHDLFDVREPFIPRTGKVDQPRALNRRLIYHPHRKHKPQPAAR